MVSRGFGSVAETQKRKMANSTQTMTSCTTRPMALRPVRCGGMFIVSYRLGSWLLVFTQGRKVNETVVTGDLSQQCFVVVTMLSSSKLLCDPVRVDLELVVLVRPKVVVGSLNHAHDHWRHFLLRHVEE